MYCTYELVTPSILTNTLEQQFIEILLAQTLLKLIFNLDRCYKSLLLVKVVFSVIQLSPLLETSETQKSLEGHVVHITSLT